MVKIAAIKTTAKLIRKIVSANPLLSLVGAIIVGSFLYLKIMEFFIKVGPTF